MKYKLLVITLIISLTTTAQKQTYLLLAYGQKNINTVCGEKIMIQQDEVSLMPIETITYRNKLLNEIRATYSKGYKNFYVELVPAGKAVIVYEFETVYTKQKDGWDCTSSFYGCVIAANMLAAEKAYAALQAQYNKSIYKEVRRWGKPAIFTPAVLGENDVDVQWKTTPSGYFLNMTNTRKDVTLSVTIVSYNRKSATIAQAGSETDLSKMTKSGETIVIIEPGATSQNTFPMADGFEMRISPLVATKAKEPLSKTTTEAVNKIIKQYLVDPNKKIYQQTSTVGVRG